jgi:hypothetical protein
VQFAGTKGFVPLSSILKALKKLESETTEFSEEPFLPQKIDRKRAFGQRAKESWLYERLLSISICTVILILGAWFVFNRETLLVAKRAPQTPSIETPARPGATSSDPLPRATPLDAALSTPPLETLREGPAAAPEGMPSEPISAPLESASMAEPQSSAAIPLEGQRVSESPATQIVQSNLKLEAIVWSNKAESRFAVINGRIVRAGGVVDGIVVTEIGRDYVSLRSGRQNWKMEFRLE